MKRKGLIALTIVGIVVIAATVVVLTLKPWHHPSDKVDTEYLSSVERDPPNDYVSLLEDIARNNNDPYVRERAIFTLANIAIRRNETDAILGFLKDVAMGEEETNVQSAAYANYCLIRDLYPIPSRGFLDLSVRGDIKKGETITLVATVLSTADTSKPAKVGPVTLPSGIELLSENVTPRLNLQPNVPQEVRFDLRLVDSGSYMIPVVLELTFDAVDYEQIYVTAALQVNETSGQFAQVEGRL